MKISKTLLAVAGASTLVVTVAAQKIQIQGAGATFPNPIYQKWFSEYNKLHNNIEINYQSLGSGAGIRQVTNQTVFFGATDGPMNNDQLQAAPGKILHFPTVLGADVPIYNLPGVSAELKFTGPVLADIFLGKVTKWNDPEIAKLNPGMNLPDTDITVVHRSDESGTTFVYTSWLADESADWNKQVGADTAVSWPTGIGADGSDGVAGSLSQTQGSIGYISYDFAVASNLSVASVQRDDGTFVSPSIDSISKAGGGLTFPIKPDTNILNAPTAGAYPITTTTYVLVYTDQTDKAKGQTLVDFLTWGLTKGQAEVTKLNYSPLPSKVAKDALAQLSQVKYQGSTIQPSSVVGS